MLLGEIGIVAVLFVSGEGVALSVADIVGGYVVDFFSQAIAEGIVGVVNGGFSIVKINSIDLGLYVLSDGFSPLCI